jgi:hypothetical protein
MEQEIVNKVALSGLVSIDMEDWYPQGPRIGYNLAQNLFMGMILREKDFREFIKTHNWAQYTDSYVYVYNSEEAIIPTWAYMLLITKLQGVAKRVVLGTQEQLEQLLFAEIIDQLDSNLYLGAKVVVKGCSKLPVPQSAYMDLSAKLLPVVQSLMFGEPCSTVPVYKKPKI